MIRGATVRPMSDKPRSRPEGVVTLPRELRLNDERATREAAKLDDVEARLVSGAISAEDADREILEMVLKERFGFLPPEAVEELRIAGLDLLDEPEMIATRAYAGERADGDEP